LIEKNECAKNTERIDSSEYIGYPLLGEFANKRKKTCLKNILAIKTSKPGFDFTKILQAAFMHADPKSTKKY